MKVISRNRSVWVGKAAREREVLIRLLETRRG